MSEPHIHSWEAYGDAADGSPLFRCACGLVQPAGHPTRLDILRQAVTTPIGPEVLQGIVKAHQHPGEA